MATYKIRWSVSATPIVEVDDVDDASLATVTLQETIRKSIGGSGELTHGGDVTHGEWDGGENEYGEASTSGVTIGVSTTQFIWVKHTGYEYSDATTLGDATTTRIKIYIDAECFASLGAGEAMVIPVGGVSTATSYKAKTASGDAIAVEHLELD
ncbi:MAG: hypothetical protein H8D23_34905 [Candidatus Brocadiales bacterium]|nr:hypothetical protein [Candidatus Brocadiales bacterium]